LIVVESMRERKALMAELSDAFLVLPGGLGTMEEFFEIWTGLKLAHHAKPIGLLDVEGFHQKLLEFIGHLGAEDFLVPSDLDLLNVSDDLDALIARLASKAAEPS
jgi:uncharacterized protein (TIGR00730 family)